ncbi:hypothetical protein, partial [Sphingomonas sp.]|uniref:hypothetical protein n=1 Tax=Sphingomonas sp. TaxID=28214 RepID=UPI003B3BAB03
MIRLLICCAFSIAAVAPTPSHSAKSLRFRALEFAQPRDPQISSAAIGVDTEYSTARQIATATGAVRAAIPIGTSLPQALAILRAAGAHCRNAHVCTYHDVETVDEYLDDIIWRVEIREMSGRITRLDVSRAWT